MEILLFGSRARGDWDVLSDTDLLVVAAEKHQESLWVDRLLVAWTKVPSGGDAGWAKRYFLRLTATGLAVLALVSLDYETSMRSTGRPGGLTTAAGRSEPRRCEGLWPPVRAVP